MSFVALNWVLESSRTRNGARLVMVVLAQLANENNETWHSMTTLSRLTGFDRRHLQRLVGEVVELGELAVEKGSGMVVRGGHTNRYRLLIPEKVVTPGPLPPEQKQRSTDHHLKSKSGHTDRSFAAESGGLEDTASGAEVQTSETKGGTNRARSSGPQTTQSKRTDNEELKAARGGDLKNAPRPDRGQTADYDIEEDTPRRAAVRDRKTGKLWLYEESLGDWSPVWERTRG